MNAYSEDLRKKIVEAVERGMPKIEAARTFGVGISSVKRYVASYREGRSLAPKKRPGSKPKLDEGARKLLEANLEEHQEATLPQRREFLRGVCGVSVSDSTVSRTLRCLGWTRKRSVSAVERDEWLRAAWRTLVAEGLDAERLVFVDEMGVNTSLFPLYAWSRRGERALASVPRNWGANVTLLASMSAEGMGPCLAVEGPTTGEVFETYLKRALAPTLGRGQVVVMDNLSSHKGAWVRELIEGRGCELIYLPPYSPDLNPIEEAFAKLKALLRRAGARTHEALIEAIGRALGAVTASDARGFFEHRGYRTKAHLL
jgi:transposase